MIGEPHEGCEKKGKWIDVSTFSMPNRLLCTGCRQSTTKPPEQSPDSEALEAYKQFVDGLDRADRQERWRVAGFWLACGVALITALLALGTALLRGP